MIQYYGPEEIENKAEELLDFAVEVSFKELNYALDALHHSNNWPVGPHGSIGVLEDVEGIARVLEDVADVVPDLASKIPLIGGLAGRIADWIIPGDEAADRLNDIREQLKTHYQDDVREYYRTFTSRITDHIRPYPALWETIVDGVDDVKGELGSGTVDSEGGVDLGGLSGTDIGVGLASAQSCAGDWDGVFAEELEHGYLIPVNEAVLPHDLVALQSFHFYSASLRDLATAKRLELGDILDKADEALQDLEAGDGMDDLKKALFVAAAALTIGTVGVTSVGVTVAGVGLSAATSYLPDDPAESDTDFASVTPAHVMAKIGTALTELKTNFQTQIDAIAGSMQTTADNIDAEVQSAVDGNRMGVFTVHTPAIATATPQEMLDPVNLIPE